MPFIAPRFRLPAEIVQADIDRILALGVEIKLNHRIQGPPEELLKQGFDAVYVACGFQQDAPLEIEGCRDRASIRPSTCSSRVARGERPDLGRRVLVIGGGNTAMDAARTAQRLTGQPATVVYRRTRAEMPAEEEELRDLFDEGNQLIELASPHRVILGGRPDRRPGMPPQRAGRARPGRAAASPSLSPAASSRSRPIPSSSAIGQKPDTATLPDRPRPALRRDGTHRHRCRRPTRRRGRCRLCRGGRHPRAGDHHPACADGRRAAEAICRQFGIAFASAGRPPRLAEDDILQVKQARARQGAQHAAGDAARWASAAGLTWWSRTLSEAGCPGRGGSAASNARPSATSAWRCAPTGPTIAFPLTPVRWRLPVLGL